MTCPGFVHCARCDGCLACDPHEHWDEYGVLIDEERVLPATSRESAEDQATFRSGTAVRRVVTASPWTALAHASRGEPA